MNPVVVSIYNKNLEVHYNCKYFYDKEGKKQHLDLQGKIKCPALNSSISSVVCSHLMDKPDWPRAIDNNICDKCECYIHLSINKYRKKPNEA